MTQGGIVVGFSSRIGMFLFVHTKKIIIKKIFFVHPKLKVRRVRKNVSKYSQFNKI